MMQSEVAMLNAKNVQGTLLVAAALTLFLPSVTWSDGTSDANEINSHKLTEAGLAKYTQATRNLGSLGSNFPANAMTTKTNRKATMREASTTRSHDSTPSLE
jgi:hypothetical protein